MSTPSDIREWASVNGIEVNPKGPIPRKVKDQFYAATGEDEPEPPAPTDDVEHGPGNALATDLPPAEEKPPAGKKPFFGRKGTAKTKRTGTGPRQSTDSLFSLLWSAGSELLNSTGNTPTARVLALQAPVAGIVLDRELRGTAVDKLAQPLAKMVNKGSSLGTLVALPLLTQVVTMRPELYPKIKPLMVHAMVAWYEIAGPELERKAKQMEKRREHLGFDPEELIDMLFSADTPEAPEEG